MADPDDDEGPEAPLEGATCSVHPDRMAFRVCPTCNKNACLGCWHPTIGRCHACLVRDATSFPPIPWEDPARSFPARFVLTLLGAISPDSSAPSFARPSPTLGVGFALLTFVPLALVAGIIPFTRTLLFGPFFEVVVARGASTEEIALDVARASAIGVALTTVMLLTLMVPYVSLSRAYADRGLASAPIRLFSYRAWLIPLHFALLHGGVSWLLPGHGPWADPNVAMVPAIVPLVLLFVAMRSVARMGSGASPLAVLAVLFVPMTLLFLSELTTMRLPLGPSADELTRFPAELVGTAPPPSEPGR